LKNQGVLGLGPKWLDPSNSQAVTLKVIVIQGVLVIFLVKDPQQTHPRVQLEWKAETVLQNDETNLDFTLQEASLRDHFSFDFVMLDIQNGTSRSTLLSPHRGDYHG
jgi:hypothetical protein